MKSVLTILSFLLVMSSEAQQVFRSLDEVQQFAAAHNTEILNAARKTSVVGNELSAARGALLPQINGSAAFQDNLRLSTTLIPAEIFGGPAGTYTEVQFGQKYNYNAFLTGSLDIVNVGSWFRIRSSKIEEQIAQASELQVKQLENEQIAAAYYMTLLSAEACHLAQLSKQSSDSLLQSVTEKRQNGLVDDITLNNLKINNRLLGDNLRNNQTIFNQNLGALKLLMGVSMGDSIVLEEKFSCADDDFSPALSHLAVSPEVSIAKFRMEQAAVSVKSSVATYAPRLSAVGSLGYQQFNQEFEPSFTNPSWKPVQYVGLRLDIPVFSGFARSNAVKNARLNLQTMQSSFAYAESKAIQDDKNLLAEFYANKEKAGNAAEIRDLYLSNYTLAGQRYREGVGNADQYLQAFTDYLSGQSRYMAAVADYYVSKAKIQNRIHSK